LNWYRLEKVGSEEGIRGCPDCRERDPGAFGRVEQ
jgi:hypothetical protein